MDLRLPDMDGADAARTLAGRPRTARIPVVALSSLRLDHESDCLRTAGFAGYLEKPISVASSRTRCAATAEQHAVLAPRAPACPPARWSACALPPTVLNWH